MSGERIMNSVSLWLSRFSGALLLVAAMGKVATRLRPTATAVAALLPLTGAYAWYFSFFVVVIEIVIAGLLISGVARKFSCVATVALGILFVAWVLAIELLGLNVGCGCGLPTVLDSVWLGPFLKAVFFLVIGVASLVALYFDSHSKITLTGAPQHVEIY